MFLLQTGVILFKVEALGSESFLNIGQLVSSLFFAITLNFIPFSSQNPGLVFL